MPIDTKKSLALMERDDRIYAYLRQKNFNVDIGFLLRSEIFTPQEHLLKGSSVEPFFYYRPYQPLCIQKDILPVEITNTIRQMQGSYSGVLAPYWGRIGWGEASLELLELNPASLQYGHTLSDPVLLHTEDIILVKADTFPFPR